MHYDVCWAHIVNLKQHEVYNRCRSTSAFLSVPCLLTRAYHLHAYFVAAVLALYALVNTLTLFSTCLLLTAVQEQEACNIQTVHTNNTTTAGDGDSAATTAWCGYHELHLTGAQAQELLVASLLHVAALRSNRALPVSLQVCIFQRLL
jgi:hypothetical protein